jgi:hypothetical protein
MIKDTLYTDLFALAPDFEKSQVFYLSFSQLLQILPGVGFLPLTTHNSLLIIFG